MHAKGERALGVRVRNGIDQGQPSRLVEAERTFRESTLSSIKGPEC